MAKRRTSSTALARPKTRTRTVYKTRRVGPSSAVVKARTAQAAKAARSRAERQAEKGDLMAVGAALLLGLAARKGVEIPTIGEIGTAGTVGLAMYAAPMVSKSALAKKARSAAIGPLSVAAHELAEDSELFSFLD